MALNFLNDSAADILFDLKTKEFCDWISEWADMMPENQIGQFDSFTENEDELKEMVALFFSPHLKRPDFGLFCFQKTFGFVCDQEKVAREIFENISQLRFNGALDRLDNKPGVFETRAAAIAFFQTALMPFAINDGEKDAFWTHVKTEMIFDDDDEEPAQKRNKI